MTNHAAATQTPSATVALTRFAGRAGDHNERAMVASGLLADVLGERLNASVTTVGEAAPALSTNWDIELEAALPDLKAMAARYESILAQGQVPVTALSRCAVALATLPVVAAKRPDVTVIWFDAHADLNTPDETTTGYLGGLALSGPLGRWNSGLGGGLAANSAILVGTRDIDAAEQKLVDDRTVVLLPVGPRMDDELASVVDGRPIYVHIDCDVLDAGTLPTEYQVPTGMTLDQLRACAQALARSELLGIEIGELETDEDAGPAADPHQPARDLVDALDPILSPLVTPA